MATSRQQEAHRGLAVYIGAPGGDVDHHLWRTFHIANLASQGTWARLALSYHSATRSTGGGSIRDRWAALSLGYSGATEAPEDCTSQQTLSLWQILQQAGNALIAKSYPSAWDRGLILLTSPGTDEEKLAPPDEARGWDIRLCLHASADTEDRQDAEIAQAGESSVRWASWDESLLPELEDSPPGQVNMIVALPRHSDALGLLALQGSTIAALGDLGTLDLLDVAPTVLSLFGLPIPVSMEGEAVDMPQKDDDPLSDAEQELLKQHLSGLGYFG